MNRTINISEDMAIALAKEHVSDYEDKDTRHARLGLLIDFIYRLADVSERERIEKGTK